MKSNQNNDTSKLIKIDSNWILSSEFGEYEDSGPKVNEAVLKNTGLSWIESINHACLSMVNEELYPKNFCNIGFIILPSYKPDEKGVSLSFLDDEN